MLLMDFHFGQSLFAGDDGRVIEFSTSFVDSNGAMAGSHGCGKMSQWRISFDSKESPKALDQPAKRACNRRGKG